MLHGRYDRDLVLCLRDPLLVTLVGGEVPERWLDKVFVRIDIGSDTDIDTTMHTNMHTGIDTGMGHGRGLGDMRQ